MAGISGLTTAATFDPFSVPWSFYHGTSNACVPDGTSCATDSPLRDGIVIVAVVLAGIVALSVNFPFARSQWTVTGPCSD
jgi:hypothetical protein